MSILEIRKKNKLQLLLVSCLTLLMVIACLSWIFPRYCHVEIDYTLPNTNCPFSVETRTERSSSKTDDVLLRSGSGSCHRRLKVDELSSLSLQFGKFSGELTIHRIELYGLNVVKISLPGGIISVKNAKIVPGAANGVTLIADKTAPRLELPLSTAIKGKRGIDWSNLLTVGGCSFFLFWVLLDMWARRREKREQFKVPKLANIEFLRVFFTLMVVLRHIALVCPAAANTGEWAVQFFFLLSGYLLFITYREDRPLSSYVFDKLIRLLPLVVLGSILCGAGAESLKGVFCLQGTGLLTRDVALNEPSWYIAVLFWCSLFYFSFRRYVPVPQGNIVIACVCFLLLIIIVQSGGGRYKLVLDYYPLGLLDGIVCMGLGYLIAQCCTRPGQSQSNQFIIGWTLAELCVFCYVILSMFCMEYRLKGDIWIRISHIALLCLFILKRGAFSSLLEHPLFAHMARYCLSIFLTHWCVIEFARRYLKVNHQNFISENQWFCVWAGMIAAIMIGVVAHHFVEKPAARYLTALFAKS